MKAVTLKGRIVMINKGCTFIASSLSSFSFGFDFENSKCICLLSCLKEFIKKRYDEGVRDFYSVCEQGVDLWAAEYVTRLIDRDKSVKLHCILPYEEQAAKWHSDIRELYYNILEKADDTEYIGLHYSDDCLKKARLFAIDRSSSVFSAAESGFGKECKEYALQNGKNVYDFFSEGCGEGEG